MSNPWAKSFEDLRAPYLAEKKAKKDYDGDGKIESGTDEYMGSKDKAIKKAMAEKGKKKVAEHHQKDAAGNTIPHEEEGDGTPSSVEEAKIDKIDPKNKRNRRNVAKFGKQTKPYDPPTKEMKTSMGKFMQKTRQDLHKNKRGVKSEEIVLESDKKGSGSGTKDACYKKVKASASVWPSAYASGRLVQCRKKGAANYGNSKKEEFDFRIKSFDDMVGECWKTHKKQGMKMKGGKMVPNCVPKNEEATKGEETLQEKSQEGGRSNFGKASVRNMRRFGYGGNNAAEKRGEAIDKRTAEHKASRGVKGSTKKREDKMKPVKWSDKNNNDNRTEEVFIEALKGKKLDIDDSGKVKNKIEINPEVRSEAAKAPVKK